jgi:gas vesicle protein
MAASPLSKQPYTRERTIFVYSQPELGKRLVVARVGHEYAFKRMFSEYIKEKYSRMLNEERFKDRWRYVNVPFKISYLHGEIGKEITLYPTITGVTPAEVKDITARLRQKVEQFNEENKHAEEFKSIPTDLEEKPVVAISHSGEPIELGKLRELLEMPDSVLEEKLSKMGKSGMNIAKLPSEDVHDLLFEISDAPEAPQDARYYIKDYLNKLRENHDRPGLELDSRVSEWAKAHAEYMAGHGRAFESQKELRSEKTDDRETVWYEFVAHANLEKEPAKEIDDILSKIFEDKKQLKKLLDAKSHVGADVAIKDNHFTICIRVK